MSRTSRRPGRDRRLRQRLFGAGNIRCPICLSEFDHSDVSAGTEVTLEHAPPKSLGGVPICLTCKSCNNKASLADQHAFLSAKARKDWAEGRGARIVVDSFGHKRSARYISDDQNAPYPARFHLFRNGTIRSDLLLRREHLGVNKGITFEIPQRDDFEFVSMIKSAYLMVFSLMGANGYKFAENVGLQPVREQIMNPTKKILGDRFIATMEFDSDALRKADRPIILMCRAASHPFWIVPMRDDKAIVLPSGGTEPITNFAMNSETTSIPFGSLTGWVSRRFNSSSAVGGAVNEESSDPQDTLAGTIGRPAAKNEDGLLYVVVFHQLNEYVALPFCPANKLPSPDVINVVDMLSPHEAAGRNLDKTQLTPTNITPWSNNRPLTRIPVDDE